MVFTWDVRPGYCMCWCWCWCLYDVLSIHMMDHHHLCDWDWVPYLIFHSLATSSIADRHWLTDSFSQNIDQSRPLNLCMCYIIFHHDKPFGQQQQQQHMDSLWNKPWHNKSTNDHSIIMVWTTTYWNKHINNAMQWHAIFHWRIPTIHSDHIIIINNFEWIWIMQQQQPTNNNRTTNEIQNTKKIEKTQKNNFQIEMQFRWSKERDRCGRHAPNHKLWSQDLQEQVLCDR